MLESLQALLEPRDAEPLPGYMLSDEVGELIFAVTTSRVAGLWIIQHS